MALNLVLFSVILDQQSTCMAVSLVRCELVFFLFQSTPPSNYTDISGSDRFFISARFFFKVLTLGFLYLRKSGN